MGHEKRVGFLEFDEFVGFNFGNDCARWALFFLYFVFVLLGNCLEGRGKEKK